MALRPLFHLATVVLAFTSFVQTAQSDVLDDIKQRDSVRLGFDDAAPFAYKTKSGTFSGYTLEICQRIVDDIRQELKRPKLKVEFVQISTESRLDKVASGAIDLECGATTNNAERRQKVAFAIPTFIAGGRMAMRKDVPIDRVEQLAGKRVAVTPSTSYDDMMNNLVKTKGMKINVTRAKDDEDGMRLLLDGKVDVTLNDDVLLATLLANSGRAPEFRISSAPLTIEPLAIVMKKDNPRLKRIADKVIASLMMSGEITQLHRKWFQTTIPDLSINLNLPITTIMRAYMRAPTDFVPDIVSY